MVCRNIAGVTPRVVWCAYAVAVLAALASASPVAPDKSWCLSSASSGEKKPYALFQSGACAKCSFTFLGPNHCMSSVGQLCPQGPIYTIVRKNGYKHCVCGKGWYGKPTADQLGPDRDMGGSNEAGCSMCYIFGTTTRGPNATSLAKCDACQSGLMFKGKAPFCDWDPTHFASADCTIPNEWFTFGVRLKSKKCGCKAGYYGTFPECRPCPNGLTSKAGNGQKCACDPKQGYIRKPGSTKPSACTCNTAKGYYPTFQNATSCVRCSKVKGGMVVTKGGKKWCGCNAKKGYGLNIAAAGTPICLKCSAVGGVLDKATGECRCSNKKGYGVEIGFSAQQYASYPNYCVDCTLEGMRVNSKGFCSCKTGYARTNYVSDRVCLPCASNNKAPVLHRTAYPQPVCGCKNNYQGYSLTAADTCSPCPPAQITRPAKFLPAYSGYDDFCRCPDPHASGDDCKTCEEGYKYDAKAKKCVMGAKCKASKWVGKWWGASAVGSDWNGTFFPQHVIDKKVPPSKTITYPSLKLDFAKSPVGSRFVAIFEITLWGKIGAPKWQGAGRYPPASRLVAVSTSSTVVAGEGTTFVPDPFGYFSPTTVVDMAGVARYGDTCKVIRLVWYGVKGGTMKARILRTVPGTLGWPTSDGEDKWNP